MTRLTHAQHQQEPRRRGDISRLFDCVDDVREAGPRAWKFGCPVCGDTAVLTWMEHDGRGARPILNCFGPCDAAEDVLGNRISIGDQILAAVGLRWSDVWGNDGSASGRYGRGGKSSHTAPRGLPDTAEIAGWNEQLLDDRSRLDWLVEVRGIHSGVVRKNLVGWNGAEYILPAYRRGELVQCYRYAPGGKLIATAGRKRPLFVPRGSLAKQRKWALLCEGELDALCARSVGLPAVAKPGARTNLRPAWVRRLRGRMVVVAYDCDDVGREAARRDAEGLATAGCDALVVDLGLDDKEDITDFFVTYEHKKVDLIALVRRTSKRRG